ncbi:hypothetical protein ACQY0O_002569 [Thecaphora frezii]
MRETVARIGQGERSKEDGERQELETGLRSRDVAATSCPATATGADPVWHCGVLHDTADAVVAASDELPNVRPVLPGMFEHQRGSSSNGYHGTQISLTKAELQ